MESQQSLQSSYNHFLDLNSIKLLQNQKKKSLDFIQKKILEEKSQCHYLLKSICIQRKFYIQKPQIIKKSLQKRVQKNKQLKRNWSINDIQILLWMVSQNLKKNGYVHLQDLTLNDWKQISDLIPGSNYKSCMIKFLSLKKINLTQIKWSNKESNLLKQLAELKYLLYRKNNKNWKKISQQLYFEGQQKTYRTPKQCREHWSSFLNPQIKKTPWSLEEDFLLFYHVFLCNGQKKWVKIKQKIHSRTQNALKNRYVLIIQKSKKQYPELDQFQLIIQYLCRLIQTQFCPLNFEQAIKKIKQFYQKQMKQKLKFDQIQQVKIKYESKRQFQNKEDQSISLEQKLNHCNNKIQQNQENKLKIENTTRQVSQIHQTKEGFYILSQKSIIK